MKKIKYLIVLVCVFCNVISVSSQGIDYNCNIDTENYVLIDSLTIEENLIDQRKAGEYLNNRNTKRPYLLITNEDEYKLFKNSNAKDIDFEQYNVFVGLFRIAICGDKPNVEMTVMKDKVTGENVFQILSYQKIMCDTIIGPTEFLIPKKYCEKYKICYALWHF